jgi:energy-coupling factor transport system permease protein
VPWLVGRGFFYWEGLAFGMTVCCRLVIPLLAFAIVFATSSPNTIVLGLVRMGMPYRVAFLVSSTFRYVPLLLEELNAMRDAQRLRGIDIDAMGMGRKLIVTGRMLVPLIVASLRRAQATEVALLARGFSSRPERTYLDEGRARLSTAERMAVVVLLALPFAALATRVWGIGGDVL